MSLDKPHILTTGIANMDARNIIRIVISLFNAGARQRLTLFRAAYHEGAKIHEVTN